MSDVKSFIRDNIEKTLELTPSVLILARLSKIAPAVLAKALVDTDANVDYTYEVAGETMKVEREKAKKDAEKNGKDAK